MHLRGARQLPRAEGPVRAQQQGSGGEAMVVGAETDSGLELWGGPAEERPPSGLGQGHTSRAFSLQPLVSTVWASGTRPLRQVRLLHRHF